MARSRIPLEAATARIPEYMDARTVKGSPDECWLWTGPMHESGYGQVRAGLGQKRRVTKTSAHRMAYMLAHPEDDISAQVIRHLCNNPKCVNPSHLAPGSHADNVADRVAAGRSATGTKNGRSKLTERQVFAIRKLLHLDATPADIAVLAGVDRAVIAKIRDGKTWRALEDVA